MSLNNIPILPDGSGPVLNTGEKVVHTTQVELEYTAGTGYPGTPSQNLHGACTLYLTAHRIVLLPTQPIFALTVCEVPLRCITSHRSTTGFLGFGARTWTAEITPTGAESGLLAGIMNLRFASGGFEFVTYLDQLLRNASNVPHIEPLPLYDEHLPVGRGADDAALPVYEGRDL
jgi:hypothetical protein